MQIITVTINNATQETLALLSTLGSTTTVVQQSVEETKPEKSAKVKTAAPKPESSEDEADTSSAVPPVDKKLASKVTLEKITSYIGELKEKASEDDKDDELRTEIKSLFKEYSIKSVSALEKENFLPFYEALTKIEL